MQPEIMNVEEAKQFLSEYFHRPVEEVDTGEIEQLYNETMSQSKEATYTGIHEELLRALNLELMSRQNE